MVFFFKNNFTSFQYFISWKRVVYNVARCAEWYDNFGTQWTFQSEKRPGVRTLKTDYLRLWPEQMSRYLPGVYYSPLTSNDFRCIRLFSVYLFSFWKVDCIVSSSTIDYWTTMEMRRNTLFRLRRNYRRRARRWYTEIVLEPILLYYNHFEHWCPMYLLINR